MTAFPQKSGRKGRVLKVKYGYNANSGSIGSFVFTLPGMIVAASLSIALLTSLVSSLVVDTKGDTPK